MRPGLTLLMAAGLLLCTIEVRAEDPFAAGADALAVKDSDGSSSLRAKLKLAKMEPDMVQAQVVAVDDAKFPLCTFTAKVTVAAESTDKHFKLMGKNKAYRFTPVLKMRGKTVDMKDQATQNNLGACYYPPGTKLVIKVPDVDLKTKMFKAGMIYLK